MIVTVTQEDIDKGVAKQCEQCPVALAVKRAAGDEEDFIHVDQFEITIGTEEYDTPIVVSQFINTFDAGGPVSPFTFEVN